MDNKTFFVNSGFHFIHFCCLFVCLFAISSKHWNARVKIETRALQFRHHDYTTSNIQKSTWETNHSTATTQLEENLIIYCGFDNSRLRLSRRNASFVEDIMLADWLKCFQVEVQVEKMLENTDQSCRQLSWKMLLALEEIAGESHLQHKI